jgi:hypothetical protein
LGDSGDIHTGATDGDYELGGLTAQPVTSSIGVSSASTSNRSFVIRFYPRLLLRVCAPVIFLVRRSFADYLDQAVAAAPLH